MADGYLSCMHLLTTPGAIRDKTLIAFSQYANSKSPAWVKDFKKKIPLPPLLKSGNIVVCDKLKVLLINAETGKVFLSKDFTSELICCSADKDNNICFMSKASSGLSVQMASSVLDILWKHDLGYGSIQQPPVLLQNGTVVIVSLRHLTAYNSQGLLWEYLCTGSEKSQCIATALPNDKVIAIDGSKLICLNNAGIIEWSVPNPSGKDFLSQPLCDKNGKVWVADGNIIYELE
jgi:hypothetical protein